MLKTFKPLALATGASAPSDASEATLKPLAYRIPAAREVSGLTRTFLYEQFNAGNLTFIKAGRATLVDAQSLETLLANLPRAAPRRPRSGTEG